MVISTKKIFQKMKTIIDESESITELLYNTPCNYFKQMLLLKLRNNIRELGYDCSILYDQENYKRDMDVKKPERELRQRKFTIEELSVYAGKSGKPAYVAVNGIVYDVTNVAAWAAATHFGLTAGKDLSDAFTSCHVDPSVLEKLPIVGKLI